MNGIGGEQHGIAVGRLQNQLLGDSLHLLTGEHVLGVRHMMCMHILSSLV